MILIFDLKSDHPDLFSCCRVLADETTQFVEVEDVELSALNLEWTRAIYKLLSENPNNEEADDV